MRHLLLFTILVLLISSFPAFARIGETEAQCNIRYGLQISAIKKGKDKIITYRFKPNGTNFNVEVHLLAGKVESIIYSRKSLPIDSSEINAILNANSRGNYWKEVKVANSRIRLWKCSNATALLMSSGGNYVFLIKTKVWDNYAKRKQNNDLKGL